MTGALAAEQDLFGFFKKGKNTDEQIIKNRISGA